MLLKVDDYQFKEYYDRLWDTYSMASEKERYLLIPSIIHIQRQCTEAKRTWLMVEFYNYFKYN